MIKHYIEFLEPGFFYPEETVRAVPNRIPAQLNLKNIPKSTYSISYYDQETIMLNNEALTGKQKNLSPRIVFGKFRNADYIRKNHGEKSTLYRNLNNSDSKKGHIECITGNWQPWYKTDIVLPNYKALSTLKEAI